MSVPVAVLPATGHRNRKQRKESSGGSKSSSEGFQVPFALEFYKPTNSEPVIAGTGYDPGAFAELYMHGPIHLSLFRYDCRPGAKQTSEGRTRGEVRHCHLQPGSDGVADWDFFSQKWHLSDPVKFVCDYPIDPSKVQRKSDEGTAKTPAAAAAAAESNYLSVGNTRLIAMYLPPNDTPQSSLLQRVAGTKGLTLLNKIENFMYNSKIGQDTQPLFTADDLSKSLGQRVYAWWRARCMCSLNFSTPSIKRDESVVGMPAANRNQVLGTPPLYAICGAGIDRGQRAVSRYESETVVPEGALSERHGAVSKTSKQADSAAADKTKDVEVGTRTSAYTNIHIRAAFRQLLISVYTYQH
jgi:hypothetical protein